jgi:hypothetical protein
MNGLTATFEGRLTLLPALCNNQLATQATRLLVRRQVFRLRRSFFETDGPSGLTSRKRGRASNRKRREALNASACYRLFRRNALAASQAANFMGRAVRNQA